MGLTKYRGQLKNSLKVETNYVNAHRLHSSVFNSWPYWTGGHKEKCCRLWFHKIHFFFHFLYDNSSKAYTQGLYHVGELRQSGNKGQFDCTFYDFYHIIGLDY